MAGPPSLKGGSMATTLLYTHVVSKEMASRAGEKPVSRVAALVIVVVWLLCVALAGLLALRVF
jgi:hypothetical protein